MPDFGKHIAQLRKFKKLTQAEFALKANINYRHFQKIEGNKTDIRMSTASEIARVLGVPVHSLFDSQMTTDFLNQGLKGRAEMLDLLPLGVSLFDRSGKIIFLNRYFYTNLTCHTPEEIKSGLYLWDLLLPEERQEAKLRASDILSKSPPAVPTRRNYLGPKNTSIFWDYIKDLEGSIKGFIGTAVPTDHLKDAR